MKHEWIERPEYSNQERCARCGAHRYPSLWRTRYWAVRAPSSTHIEPPCVEDMWDALIEEARTR